MEKTKRVEGGEERKAERILDSIQGKRERKSPMEPERIQAGEDGRGGKVQLHHPKWGEGEEGEESEEGRWLHLPQLAWWRS